jgi:hypothetical protein
MLSHRPHASDLVFVRESEQDFLGFAPVGPKQARPRISGDLVVRLRSCPPSLDETLSEHRLRTLVGRATANVGPFPPSKRKYIILQDAFASERSVSIRQLEKLIYLVGKSKNIDANAS